MRRRRLTIGAVVGAFFLLLGIVDVPDQLAKWGKVFRLLEGERGRWLIVLLGLVIVVIAALPELRDLVVRLLAGAPPAPAVAVPPRRPGRAPQGEASTET